MPMARAMCARGHEVLVVVPAYDDPRACCHRWDDAGVEVQVLPRPRAATLPGVGEGLAQISLARSCLKVVGGWCPDIVHVFKPKAVSGLVQTMLWWQHDRPGIVLDSDDWEGRTGWGVNETYTWWQREAIERQETWGLRACDARTAASALLAERHGTGPSVRIVNGYDAATYASWRLPERRLCRDAKPRILIYTRFYDFSHEGWSRLILGGLRAIPGSQMAIVGAGSRSPIDRILGEAAALGLAGRIHVHGWVRFELLPDVFQTCDIALMPFADTVANQAKCSVRYMDLMVAGLPIIASPVGESGTYVRDGETGYLAEDDSAEALVAAAVRAVDDPARSTVADRAGAYAKGDLNWHRLTRPLESLYVSAMASS